MGVLPLYYLWKAWRSLRWSREGVRGFQSDRLKEIVGRASESVPFYQEHPEFPSSIQGIDEIDSLPIVSGGAELEFDRMVDSSIDIGRRLVSSGTTGRARKTPFDRASSAWMTALHIRSLMMLGYRPFRAISKYWDRNIDRSWLGRWCMPYRMVYRDDPYEHQLRMLANQDADFVSYYPQALFALAKYALAAGDEESVSPDRIFVHGELLTDEMRSFIERVFDTTVRELYMMSEFGVVAWECPDGGYHLVEDNVIPEVVDRTGERVGAGEVGELVLTNLSNWAMPHIRYGTGDLVHTARRDCSCDTSFRRIRRICGREEHCLYREDERILPVKVVSVLSRFSELLHFQVAGGPGGYVVRVEPVPGAKISHDEVKGAVEAETGLVVEVNEMELPYRTTKVPLFDLDDGGEER